MSGGLRPRLRRDLGHAPLWWFCVGPAFKPKDNFTRTPRILSNSSDLQKSQNIVNITSRSDLKLPKGSRKHSQRIPMGTKSDPRVASRDPKGIQMSPKRPQSDPKGTKGVPKERQKTSKMIPKSTQKRSPNPSKIRSHNEGPLFSGF